ncbi:sulfotransferase family 2 domain-containing protein [uncultured Nonlabens sp.]|uniref:sulfotransferase family 2 domain-containing protein n=1 Tax=uncultured Nonlabens sp. TaxID=859306 RepID=UPI0030D768DF
MISHQHKCIFIHIPKCAGTTIKYMLFPNEKVDWQQADYDKLHGWCPKRKFFMQHATAQQLLETELISEDIWNSYYKFTFVRNPWDRAVSDYFWLMNDQNIKDSFENYILRKGTFTKFLNDKEMLYYRGDHLELQTNFFDMEGLLKMDFVGKFEHMNEDLNKVKEKLGLANTENLHINKSKKKNHYSEYFSNELKKSFDATYKIDIDYLGYQYEQQSSKKSIFSKLFKL